MNGIINLKTVCVLKIFSKIVANTFLSFLLDNTYTKLLFVWIFIPVYANLCTLGKRISLNNTLEVRCAIQWVAFISQCLVIAKRLKVKTFTKHSTSKTRKSETDIDFCDIWSR